MAHQHPLLVERVTHCDHCANSLPSSGTIVRDLGEMTIKMNNMSFCSKVCETAMIGNLLSSGHVSEAQRSHIKRVAPGAAAKYQRSIQSSIAENIAESAPAASIKETLVQRQSAPAAPIEAEFLTHVKRALTHDHYAVDSVSMAEDIIRRIDYHDHHIHMHHKHNDKHGGGVATAQAPLPGDPASHGEVVWKHAMERFVSEGGKDVDLANQAFHTTLQNVMALENESRPYWTHKGHDLHNVVHWHEDELSHDIGLLMRSVMDPKLGGANYAKLDMVLQAVAHRVIQERGVAGYNFLETFFGLSASGDASAQAEQEEEASAPAEEGDAAAAAETEEAADGAQAQK